MSARKTVSEMEKGERVKAEVLKKAEPVEPEKESKETDIRIYIGPTIMGVAGHNQIFSNGIPDALKEAVRECPPIGKLVVGVDGLSEAMMELQKKDLVLDICYQQAVKYEKEKRNGGL